MRTDRIVIEGLKDAHDAEKVGQALYRVWGIREAEVRLERGEVLVSFDERAASLHDFRQAIEEAGFQVRQTAKEPDAIGGNGR